MQFNIVDEHSDYVVAVKPSGVSFHSETGPGFVALLESQLNYKLYPVHRLDKVTSGLIVLARSSETAATLTALFTERKVDKFYLAITHSKPKKKQGWVKGDMEKSRRGTFKLMKSSISPAITRLYSFALGNGFRLWLMKPFSGKTHQLRVALKSLSAPILGDTSYGGEASDRVYLHAFRLEFHWEGEFKKYAVLPSEGVKFLQLDTLSQQSDWQDPNNFEW